MRAGDDGRGSVARQLANAWLFHLRNLSRSTAFLFVCAVQPLIFATIAFLVFGSGDRADLLPYAVWGAGLMGIWSTTLTGSGGVVVQQRFQGTLEPMVASPRPLLFSLLPITMATATLGLYSLVATVAWGRLLFGIEVKAARPGWLVVALLLTVVCLGALGLLMAATFVLTRYASSFGVLLEYPVWMASGLLVPVDQLPGWVEPISWILGPTWGVRAVRDAALGGDPAPAVLACAALAVSYLVCAAAVLRYFETLTRRRATLALS